MKKLNKGLELKKVSLLLIMILTVLTQIVYCQNIPKSKPLSEQEKLTKYREALVNCDNEKKKVLFDYKYALESDSLKGSLIKTKNERIKNDSLLVINLRGQIQNVSDKLLISQSEKKKIRLKPFIVTGIGGVIVGYIIRKQVQTFLTNLAK